MIPGRVEFSLRAAERAGEQLRHLVQVPAAMVAPVVCLAHRLPPLLRRGLPLHRVRPDRTHLGRPATLRVTMDSPALAWTLTATSTRILALLNTMSAAMPLATWRPRSLVRARERLASALGMGQLKLTGTMPSGHTGTLMPGRMYFIDDSQATLDGVDLGRPARLRANPVIGGIPLPARGVLATGQAVFEILDPAKYQRTRPQAAAAA